MDLTKNKSRIFLLPMINDVPYTYFKDCINCYVDVDEYGLIEEKSYIGESLYVIFNSSSLLNTEYLNLSSRAIKNSDRWSAIKSSTYFKSLTVKDRFVTVRFDLQRFQVQDVKYFLDGYYSNLSITTKHNILNAFNNNSKLRGILYKEEKYMKELSDKLGVEINQLGNELLDKPLIEQEVFSVANIISINSRVREGN